MTRKAGCCTHDSVPRTLGDLTFVEVAKAASGSSIHAVAQRDVEERAVNLLVSMGHLAHRRLADGWTVAWVHPQVLTGNGSALGAHEAPGKEPDNGELASRLNKLFEVMRKAGTHQLSNAAAAAAITSKTGVPISPAYLWQLRNGIKTNPTVAHLRAIADFFGLPASYLVDRDTDPTIDAQLNLLQALRDSGVRDLATRAAGLTPRALNGLAVIIDHLRDLERLPPIAPQGDDQSDGRNER